MITGLLALLLVIATPTSLLSAEFLDVTYHQCQDAKTCEFRVLEAHPIFGENVIVRITGINVPLMSGKCSLEHTLAVKAKNILHEILNKAHTIDLIDAKRGKFFRYSARIRVDGTDVGKMLIDRKLAVSVETMPKSGIWCPSQHPHNEKRL